MKDFVLKHWKIILIVLLAGALFITIRTASKNKSKYQRERNNVEALMTELEHEKTKRGEDVTTIQELQLTVSEFKKLRAEDVKLIEELKIKPPQIKEVVKTVVETKIVYRDSLVQVSPGKYEWNKDTKWWTVNQQIDFNENPPINNFKMTTRDSLTHVLYKVPKCKFLGIRFGIKGYEIKVINHNPDGTILYNSWINVSKDKTRRKRD
jgi:hypothetical protein